MIVVIGAFPASGLTLVVLDKETNKEMYRSQFWYPAFLPTIDAVLKQFKGDISEIMICGPESYTGELAMKLMNRDMPKNIQISLMPVGEEEA